MRQLWPAVSFERDCQIDIVATFELAAAPNMRIVVSAGSVAMCPAHGIEEEAHGVAVGSACCGCNLVLVAVLPLQYPYQSD